jgi:hypothetical protein
MNAPLRAKTSARAMAKSLKAPRQMWLATGALLIAGAVWALPGWAQDTIITSHGYSTAQGGGVQHLGPGHV